MTFKQNLFKYYLFRRISSCLLYVVSRILRSANFVNKVNPDRALIISLHKIGDTVLTLPAVEAILKTIDKQFYFLCFEHSKIIYQSKSVRAEYIIVDKRDFIFGERLAKSAIRKKMKELAPSMIIDLTGSIKTASILLNSKSKEIIGVSEDVFKNLYTKFVPMRKTPHLSDIYIDLFNSVYGNKKYKVRREFEINYDPEEKILIHPFAGWAAKEWGLNQFLMLYKRLTKNFKCKLIFEKAIVPSDIISDMRNESIEFIETSNIQDLILELRNCSALISNDSGPLHLASMLGKPTFSIFGPTNPKFHVPLGDKHSYVNGELSCSPTKEKYCFTYGGRFCPSYDCMRNLSIELVEQGVTDWLAVLGIKHYHNSEIKIN